MSVEMQFTEREIQKQAISQEIEQLGKLRESTLSQHDAMARWILASLVAVNGGGALAALNLAKDFPYALFSGPLFIFGLCSALIGGVLTQKASYASLRPISSQMAYHIHAINAGTPPSYGDQLQLDELKAQADSQLVELASLHRKPAIAGWVAGGLFLAANLVVGLAVGSQVLNFS